MSGYEKISPSKLGGGVPGKFEVAYGNTMKGGEIALNRRKLRKAFKTNKVAKAGNISSLCGPFRSAYQLGDPLGRRNKSCGGCNQVNDVNSNVLSSSRADSVSNADCDVVVYGATTSDVPISSGNGRHVSDSSMFVQFKHLSAMNLTYNDETGGGDNHNGSYSFINNLRG